MTERNLEFERTANPRRVGSERHAAAATESTRHGTLGLHREPGGAMGQQRQLRAQRMRVAAHFDAERALPGARQHPLRLEARTNALRQTETHQPGGREHDGVVAAVVELAQACIEVAAQRLHIEVRPQRDQLHDPPQARCADSGAQWQFVERAEVVGDKSIARVFTFEHRRQLETFGQVHRHVFERVHRQLSAALFKRRFELLDKQPLATDLGQAAVEYLVAARRHAEQRHRHSKTPHQQVAHMLGLPERQTAFAGRDEGGCGHRSMLAGASLA